MVEAERLRSIREEGRVADDKNRPPGHVGLSPVPQSGFDRKTDHRRSVHIKTKTLSERSRARSESGAAGFAQLQF